MIHTLGNITLIGALFFSFLQSLLPLLGFKYKNIYLLASSRICVFGQSFFIFAAYLCLTTAFLTDQFSILYVALNSHTDLPFVYKLTAVWGAHEGSILLWIVVLNVWTLSFIFLQRNHSALSLIISFLGMIAFCFNCFLFFTSNPFSLAPSNSLGYDLNPLLQDPGFVSHPPMLYMGYVGFSIVFAITQAALIQGKFDKEWVMVTKKFTLAAWVFLTLGILLGSLWAYRVLGWGGFWFWDPVENASLLPWLTSTALIHVLVLVDRRKYAINWAVLLCNICFALSLLGTFLVRSGILVSAHTFANDPTRGIFLLTLLAFILTLTTFIHHIRAKSIPTGPHYNTHWLSRDYFLLLNSAMLIVCMLTVLIGTLYPLILEIFHLGSVSVGAPYFNQVLTPFVLVGLISMVYAPLCVFDKQSIVILFKRTWVSLFSSVGLTMFVLFYLKQQLTIFLVIVISSSVWIIIETCKKRFISGMNIAHLGFAVFIIGIVCSSYFNMEKQVKMKPGDHVLLGPYDFMFVTTSSIDDSNFKSIQAMFDVTKRHHHVISLYPEKRFYTVREMVMSHVAIHPSIFRDLYIALGEPLEGEYWSVRLYYKPFVRWIWSGGMIMMIGGLLALYSRRYAQ